MKMPTYTVRRENGEEEWDVMCSHKELVEMLNEYKLVQVYKPLNLIHGQEGSTRKAAGHEWNDMLKQIKKGSGRGNTIKT